MNEKLAKESSEEFSTAFLGKSKSYYRAMKAQNLEANNSLLTNLLNELNIVPT
jgi:hypothetical protein